MSFTNVFILVSVWSFSLHFAVTEVYVFIYLTVFCSDQWQESFSSTWQNGINNFNEENLFCSIMSEISSRNPHAGEKADRERDVKVGTTFKDVPQLPTRFR